MNYFKTMVKSGLHLYNVKVAYEDYMWDGGEPPNLIKGIKGNW